MTFKRKGINPLLPSVPYNYDKFSQNFDFNLRRNHQKISYERGDYESVDEKEHILGYVKN